MNPTPTATAMLVAAGTLTGSAVAYAMSTATAEGFVVALSSAGLAVTFGFIAYITAGGQP